MIKTMPQTPTSIPVLPERNGQWIETVHVHNNHFDAIKPIDVARLCCPVLYETC